MRCSGAIRCFPAPPRPQPRLILLHQKIDGHRARYGFHQRVWVSDHPAPWAQALSGLALLVMAATLANAVVKQVILRLLERGLDTAALAVTSGPLDPIVRRLSNLLPASSAESRVGKKWDSTVRFW